MRTINPELVDYRGRGRRKSSSHHPQNSNQLYTSNKGGAVGAAIAERISKLSESNPDFSNMSERRKAKLERKKIKAEAKAEKKTIKAEGKRDKKTNNSLANLELAKQGINARAQLASGILGGMAKVAGAVGGSVVGAQAVKALPSILGSKDSSTSDQLEEGLTPNLPQSTLDIVGQSIPLVGGALSAKMNQSDPLADSPQIQHTADGYNQSVRYATTDQDQDNTTNPKSDSSKNNNLLYIGGAIAVIAVLAIVFLKSKK